MSVFLACALAFLAFPTDTPASDSVVIGEHIRSVVLETPHPYPCPSCPNRGVRIQNIWDKNQIGSHPLPACSLVSETGSIELDRARHGCADSIGIQVIDASLQGAGSPSMTLWSNSESSPETAWLAESPAGSGMFAGSFSTPAAPPSGADARLSVSDGDTITVRYIDVDDGLGGVNVPRDASAVADCAGPQITGVAAHDLLGDSARVLWDTDEPANSLVFYGTSPGSWLGSAEGLGGFDALAMNCWPAPEVADNVNHSELGDLKLSPKQESDLVEFLKTLSDGYVL